MAPRNVLIPLDGSRLAERSLVYVHAFAHVEPVRLSLLSVIDEAEMDAKKMSGETAVDRERNLLETYLDDLAVGLREQQNIEVETEVVAGSPAQLILERSMVIHPDLLIVSTHARSGWTRWRVGSVADKLIRSAGCPTLIVGPRSGRAEGRIEVDSKLAFKKILVPLDGSPLGEQALNKAEEYARLFNSDVRFVRVVNAPVHGISASNTPRLEESLENEAREYLTKVAAQTATPRQAKIEVLTGEAVDALQSYIGVNEIDLVVMASHGRSGLFRAALGSVTDRLLGSSAPVLVVRAAPAQ